MVDVVVHGVPGGREAGAGVIVLEMKMQVLLNQSLKTLLLKRLFQVD